MSKSGKPSADEARAARLRAALRENLKRRKAQAKSRASVAAPMDKEALAVPISAGIAGDKPKG